MLLILSTSSPLVAESATSVLTGRLPARVDRSALIDFSVLPRAETDAMYYPSQSPGVGHKLQSHHEQNPWARSHYGPPTGQPSVGPPPTSPGYALYTNPAVPHMQHHPGTHPHALSHTTMHHQQNSLSHYSSPQNGHTLAAHMNTASPGAQQAEMMTTHWQQQLLKCEVSRYQFLATCASGLNHGHR